MKPQETIALDRLIASKAATAARNDLAEGTYTVDFTVRVQGKLDVLADQQYTPTISMSPLMLAALAIKGRGATEAAFKAKLAELMRAAVQATNSGDTDTAKLVQWVKEAMGEVKGELAKLPKERRKGAVRPSLTVAKVERELTTGKLRKAKVASPDQTELV
jgi:hypothetical protein